MSQLPIQSPGKYDLSKIDWYAEGTARVRTDEAVLHAGDNFNFVPEMMPLAGKTIIIKYDSFSTVDKFNFKGRDADDPNAWWWHWEVQWLQDITLPVPPLNEDEEEV